MSLITPQRFIELKARVKAECNRRRYVGSVQSYAGVSYDYSSTPTTGGIILSEYRSKIAVPLNAINSTRVPVTNGDVVISESDLAAMESFVTQLESNYMTSSTTDCASSCTGTCYTECSTNCTGDCSGTCDDGCWYNCMLDCSNSCEGDCGDVCGGSCGVACGDTCSGDCYQGCGGGCEDRTF